jgi:hypothetical protein
MRSFLVLALLVVASTACDRHSSAKPTPPNDYFAKKRECYELVEKRDEHESANHPDWLLPAPQECYVPSLNTCICEYVPKKGPSYVSDVLTGTTLLWLGEPAKAGEPADKYERYQRARDQLFSLCAK